MEHWLDLYLVFILFNRQNMQLKKAYIFFSVLSSFVNIANIKNYTARTCIIFYSICVDLPWNNILQTWLNWRLNLEVNVAPKIFCNLMCMLHTEFDIWMCLLKTYLMTISNLIKCGIVLKDVMIYKSCFVKLFLRAWIHMKN